MAWGARELHITAQQLLAGEPLIVVSSREPWVHELADDGSLSARHSVGGLVAALDPVLRATGGTWIAHGSGSADHNVVDRVGRIRIERADGGYTLRRVWLSRREERGYYRGFSNSGLWPLCHLT